MLYTILMGALIGWLAGKIMKGGGFGFLINMILGIIGGAVGSWLFGILGITILEGGIIGKLVTGVAGASVILFVAGLLKK